MKEDLCGAQAIAERYLLPSAADSTFSHFFNIKITHCTKINKMPPSLTKN